MPHNMWTTIQNSGHSAEFTRYKWPRRGNLYKFSTNCNRSFMYPSGNTMDGILYFSPHRHRHFCVQIHRKYCTNAYNVNPKIVMILLTIYGWKHLIYECFNFAGFCQLRKNMYFLVDFDMYTLYAPVKSVLVITKSNCCLSFS